MVHSVTASTDAIIVPLVEEIAGAPDPVDVFRRLCHLPHCVFLDSAVRPSRLAQYSFISADPFAFVREPADGSDGLRTLESHCTQWPCAKIENLPPFQGGAAGIFSYDLGLSFERLPRPRFDEFGVPAVAMGLYDFVVAFDHRSERCWIVSTGIPERDPVARRRRSAERLAGVRRLLDSRSVKVGSKVPDRVSTDRVPLEQLAPQSATAHGRNLTSNFSAQQYHVAVERAIDYIRAGDIFQVNLAQRMLHPQNDDSVSLYLRLRERNPAPFAGFFDAGGFQIISASPERFLHVDERRVEARPIKGTRPRMAQPEADLYAADDLERSEKDRAENVMIVDLLRNDLSRVCRPDSVRVTQLCQLESYAYVQHLVSAVVGNLRPAATTLDLVRVAFPGGSITGAPKVRAMEIIAELEPSARGAYCGSLGYLGFNGSMDLNILIRTITAGRGWWQLPVGGGIVAQSSPSREYAETWHKAEGMLRAL